MIPADDPRAAHQSSNAVVDRAGLAEFLADKHRWVLATTRADGRPQLSLVTGGMMADGCLAIASYPERAKVRNARRDPRVSVAVMGSEFNDAWVQVDGSARVLDMPEAGDAFVEYFRCISGEHPDWHEYLDAMAEQGKCLIVIDPERWSPVSRGGFPPSRSSRDRCADHGVRRYGSAMTERSTYSFTKLVVHDLEAMRRYYDEVFGLVPIQRVEADIAEAPIEELILGRDGAYGGLILLRWVDAAAPPAGEVILGFTTSDVGALFERATAAGGTVREAPEPSEAAGGLVVGFVEDPEGHLAEVVEQ